MLHGVWCSPISFESLLSLPRNIVLKWIMDTFWCQSHMNLCKQGNNDFSLYNYVFQGKKRKKRQQKKFSALLLIQDRILFTLIYLAIIVIWTSIIILLSRQKMKQPLFSLYAPINSWQIQIHSQTEINRINLIIYNIKRQKNYKPSVAPSKFLFTISWFRQHQYSQNQWSHIA